MMRASLGLPAGYRAMTAEECEALASGDTIAVLDAHTGDIWDCRVHSWTDSAVNVCFLGTHHIEALDVDDPSYWGDDVTRVRNAPMSEDGQFVAVVNETDAWLASTGPAPARGVASALDGESETYRDAMRDSGRER